MNNISSASFVKNISLFSCHGHTLSVLVKGHLRTLRTFAYLKIKEESKLDFRFEHYDPRFVSLEILIFWQFYYVSHYFIFMHVWAFI